MTRLATTRLDLVVAAPQHLLALIEHPDTFEHLAGFPVARELHDMYASDSVSPQWLAALRQDTAADPWRHGFFLLHRGDGLVIGAAGYKGPPDANGAVEIAYGVAPKYQGQGYATEAAAALVMYAIGRGARRILAHTMPEANASTHVLKKCGFQFAGPVVDPEDGPVWRWERGQ